MPKTHEQIEKLKEHGAERWIIITAALLAVIGAIANLFATQRANGALHAKDEAIIAQTRAADTWAFYEARSIKEHVYRAAIDSSPDLSAAQVKRLRAVAEHEAVAKAPLQAQAEDLEKRVRESEERSERLLRSHETLEVSVTFFEIAIAVISIAALTSSRALLVVALAGAAAGIVFALLGYPV